LVSQSGYQVGILCRASLFVSLLIQYKLDELIFSFTLIALSGVWIASQRGKSWFYQHVNLRGYSCVVKIESELPISVTASGINLASPSISFPWVILSSLVRTITVTEPTPGDVYW
jgi:hypothetical protein